MRSLFVAAFTALALAPNASAQPITGSYRLISIAADYGDGSVVETFGKHPSGYAIITPKRFTVVLVAENRKAGTSPEEKLALFGSQISYSGLYQIEGTRFITQIDVSWNQVLTGTKQERNWMVEGNHLVFWTDKTPSVLDASKTTSTRTVWERVE